MGFVLMKNGKIESKINNPFIYKIAVVSNAKP